MDQGGDTEIQDTRFLFLGDHHIARFDVAMQQIMRMRVSYCIQNRFEQRADFLLHDQTCLRTDIILQVLPVGVLHDQVDRTVLIDMVVMEGDDILMVQFRQMLRLLFEFFPGVVIHHLGVDHLDGCFLHGDEFVFRQIDAPHASFSDQRDNAVIEHFFSDHTFVHGMGVLRKLHNLHGYIVVSASFVGYVHQSVHPLPAGHCFFFADDFLYLFILHHARQTVGAE